MRIPERTQAIGPSQEHRQLHLFQCHSHMLQSCKCFTGSPLATTNCLPCQYARTTTQGHVTSKHTNPRTAGHSTHSAHREVGWLTRCEASQQHHPGEPDCRGEDQQERQGSHPKQLQPGRGCRVCLRTLRRQQPLLKQHQQPIIQEVEGINLTPVLPCLHTGPSRTHCDDTAKWTGQPQCKRMEREQSYAATTA